MNWCCDCSGRTKPRAHRRSRPRPTARSGVKTPSQAGPSPDTKDIRADCVIDAVEDHEPTHCPRCHLPFGAGDERELIGEYDEVEIPPVRPFVRRHRRFAIRCSCCGDQAPAPLPAAAKGTPFGPRIHALAIYLKSRQACHMSGCARRSSIFLASPSARAR